MSRLGPLNYQGESLSRNTSDKLIVRKFLGGKESKVFNSSYYIGLLANKQLSCDSSAKSHFLEDLYKSPDFLQYHISILCQAFLGGQIAHLQLLLSIGHYNFITSHWFIKKNDNNNINLIFFPEC